MTVKAQKSWPAAYACLLLDVVYMHTALFGSTQHWLVSCSAVKQHALH